MHRVRSDLRRLTEANRRHVLRQWRWLLFKQQLHGLPLPIKHISFTAVSALLILSTLPRHHLLPPVVLPVVSAASFALGLAIACLIHPRPRAERIR